MRKKGVPWSIIEDVLCYKFFHLHGKVGESNPQLIKLSQKFNNLPSHILSSTKRCCSSISRKLANYNGSLYQISKRAEQIQNKMLNKFSINDIEYVEIELDKITNGTNSEKAREMQINLEKLLEKQFEQ